jgi:hypothetical protein
LQDFLVGNVVFPPKELVAKDTKTKFAHPEYARMVAKEQQVLNYLLSSLSHELLLQAAAYDTPEKVWAYIMSSFESQSRARVLNMHMALSTTKKGDMTINKYVTKMKALADEMTSAGKSLDDEELVSYILAGHDSEFDGVISVVSTRVEPINVSELYGQLLAHEQRWELRQTSEYHAANAVTRGGRGDFGCGHGNGRGCGDFGGRGNGSQESNYNNPNSRSNLQCQLCGKKGHVMHRCFKRFVRSFSGEEKTTTPATTSYGIDTNWYADSGITDHITSDLGKLYVRDKYGGNDQVHMANGTGMKIHHIGNTTLHTPSRDLILKNILHVSATNKNLVSIHRFPHDNHVFFELHP